MFRIILIRVMYSIPVLLLLTLIMFFSIRLIPGDIARVMAGERATPEVVEMIRETYHLNDPWYVQYGTYLQKLVTEFDLGMSIQHDKPITEVLATFIPATLELGICALLIAIPIGIFLGAFAAIFRGSWIDKASTSTALFGVSMPIFWLALTLQYFLAVQLNILPSSSRLPDEVYLFDDLFDETEQSLFNMYVFDGLYYGFRYGEWDLFLKACRHMFLPALTLASVPVSYITRMTRTAFLDVIHQDYIRTAKSKGLSFWKVMWVHAFRNASLQIVTIVALQAGAMFAGAVLTETMYSWPGLGRELISSIATRDFRMVQSGTLFIGSIFILFNLIADLLYGVLDPRTRVSSVGGK